MYSHASPCSLIHSRASEAVLAALMVESSAVYVARCLLSKASAGDACLCPKLHPSIQELDKAITRYKPSSAYFDCRDMPQCAFFAYCLLGYV